MTEAEKIALAMVNKVWAERGDFPPIKIFRNEHSVMEALCRAIEAHEAFKQSVSDAVKDTLRLARNVEISLGSVILTKFRNNLSRFIIRQPVDPLVEALQEIYPDGSIPNGDAENLRQALAARGLQIVEIGQ